VKNNLIHKKRENPGLRLGFSLFLFIVGIAGIIFFAKTQDIIGGDLITSVQSIFLPKEASLGLPIRLKISRINVNAVVEQVGLTFDWAMDVPKVPSDVAWFDLGPRPGEVGSAVISGHYGWKNGIPAAFDSLYKLQKGDKIFIGDDKGATTTFMVREIRLYEQNADASGVFWSTDGKSHLNLITCEGVWNSVKKSYSNRLVVFADKIE
jgi:LPXTG-site transpeptidase (sortase) family protein